MRCRAALRRGAAAIAAAAILLALAGSAAAQRARVFAPDSCVERTPPPPVDLRARAVNESAITVTWKAPTTDACIDTYDYYVLEAGQPQPRALSPRSRDAYSLTVTGLKRGTPYQVFVASANAQRGRGQYASVNVATRQERCGFFSFSRPGAVSDISFTQTSSSRAFMSWLPPDKGCVSWYLVDAHDGATGRRVSRRVSVNADEVVAVQPNRRYEYRVTPFSLFGGEGPEARATLTTASAGPRVG